MIWEGHGPQVYTSVLGDQCIGSPEAGVAGTVCCLMWLLETEPASSPRPESVLNREPSLQPPPSPLSFLTLPLTQTLPQASLQSLYSKYNRRKLFFSAKMQILLPLQSIKTRSEERGFFLADAPSEGAETKLWRPNALKALGSLGSYEPLLDLEVFIEYPVI